MGVSAESETELGSLPGITITEIVKYLGNSSHVGETEAKDEV